jgi:peptide/nickel transport system substrate-binding protein
MAEQNYWMTFGRRGLSRRRFLAGTAIAGSALVGPALAACGGQKSGAGTTTSSTGATTAAGTPRSGGTLNVYLPYNAPLDPQKVSNAAQQAVAGVYSRVFRFKTGSDPSITTNQDVESDLGLSAESPDAITWTIKLRPGAKFHNIAPVNGHAVEAEDVKATFTRALDPATGDPNAGSLGMIDAHQIQTPDASTVVFKLNYAYAPFRIVLGSPNWSLIFPREVLAGSYDPAKTVIGSGPFLLDTAQPDVAYTYTKNPNWFEQGQPYVDNVRVAVIPDASQQLAQWAAGNLDELILDNLDNANAAQQRQPKATLLKLKFNAAYPIYFQMGEPNGPFQDIRLRQAVSMAIDRQALAKVVYNGEADSVVFVPASYGKWAMRVQDLPADVKPFYMYNVAEAKRLVQAAGVGNTQFKLAYNINGPTSFAPSPAYKSTVETIANTLNAVGLKTVLITQDYNKDFVDAGKGARQGYYDATTMEFVSASANDPDGLLFSYFHSKSTANQEQLKDPTLDAMIDKERTLVNDDERLKAVQDIQRYLAQKMYAPSTVGPNTWAAANQRVQNYQYSSNLGKMTETYAKLWLQA